MNFNGVPNVNMTTTVQAMADQLKLHTKLQSYFNVGGVNGQPMLSIAERVNQMLLIRRMAWKFNRVDMGSNNPAVNPHFFVSQLGFQDYKHAGASCFTLINSTTPGGQLPAGGAGVDLNPGVYQNAYTKVNYGTFNGGGTYGPTGNWQTAGVIFDPLAGTVTVQFLDPHPFRPENIGASIVLIAGVVNPAYNSLFTYNQLDQTSQWFNGYQLLAVPDHFHVVLATNGRQMGAITNISAAGGVTTVAVVNGNGFPMGGFVPGGIMTFASIGVNTGLNGKTVTLLTATGTAVTFTTPTGVAITNGADSGTIYAAPSGAPGIWNLGWIQAAALIDINNPSFPLPVNPIDAVHRLSPEYTATGDNISLSCERDFGNGVVEFRISEPVSTYPFAFSVVYQARAPKFINGQSVFQWPDDLSYVIFELCLAMGMRFAYGMSAAETQQQIQMAQAAIMNALQSEDREANTESITPQFSLMR